MFPRVALVLLVVAVLVGLLVFSQHRRSVPKVSGFIESDEIRLGSRIGGRVAEVTVHEGQEVSSGQTLLRLEPFDLAQREAEAAALLAAREQELARLKAGYRPEEITQSQQRALQLQAKYDLLKEGPRPQETKAAEARLRLAIAQLELAQMNYSRYRSLLDKNGVSQSEMDKVSEELKTAQNNREVREQELDLLKEGTRKKELEQAEAQLREAQAGQQMMSKGFRSEEIAQAQAARDAAQAALEIIRIQKGELEIKAPSSAVVEALDLRPGDLVSPNAPVLSLLDRDRLWVRCYVPENRVTIQQGQDLKVTVDSLPGEQFRGKVTYISRQAEFTPSNVQTEDERAKQVFRMKVEIRDSSGKLRPGMAADVWLDPPSP